MVKDYNCEILYHLGKANVVADALSQKGLGQIHGMRLLARKSVDDMTRAGIELLVGQLANITLHSTLLEKIKEGQLNDPQLIKIREDVLAGASRDYTVSELGLLRYRERICVPLNTALRREILDESHTTPYSLHRGTTKMY